MPNLTKPLPVAVSSGRFAFIGLLGVLVWAPLPLASNRSWALALLAMLCSGLLLAALASSAWARRPAAKPARALWVLPLGLLAAYGGLVLLQLVPLPQGLRALLVPGATGSGPVTVDPFATLKYLLAFISYGSVFALVVLLVDSKKRLRWLMGTVLVSGTAQALLAVYLLSLRADYEFLFTTFPAGGRATGTFANTDHLAGYLQLALAMGVGLMLTGSAASGAQGRGWRAKLVVVLEFLLSARMLVRLMLVTLVIALVLTISRAGNAAFVTALLLTGVWVALRSRQLRTTAIVVVVSMILVDVVVVGHWVGLDKVVERLKATTVQRQEVASGPPQAGEAATAAAVRRAPRREESLEERLYAARYALGMPQERPLLGFGGGTFHVAFPRFKGDHPLGHYDHAHNDYVEIAADTGLLGLALLLGLAVASFLRAARAVSDRRDEHTRGAAVAVVMASISMGVHSFVDFNMHVPANALTFCAVLALAWCGATQSRRGLASARVGRDLEDADAAESLVPAGFADVAVAQPKTRWLGHQGRQWLVLGVVTVGTAWTFGFGQAVLRADLGTAGARQQVADWAYDGKGWTVESWQDVRRALLRAQEITPTDPMPHDFLAQLYITQGVAAWDDPVQREAYFAEASDHLEALLRLRAHDGRAWATLAQARYVLRRPAAEVQQAWNQALRYSPREAAVQQALALLVLDTWEDTTPDMRAWLQAFWAESPPPVRNWLQEEAKRVNREGVFK